MDYRSVGCHWPGMSNSPGFKPQLRGAARCVRRWLSSLSSGSLVGTLGRARIPNLYGCRETPTRWHVQDTERKAPAGAAPGVSSQLGRRERTDEGFRPGSARAWCRHKNQSLRSFLHWSESQELMTCLIGLFWEPNSFRRRALTEHLRRVRH